MIVATHASQFEWLLKGKALQITGGDLVHSFEISGASLPARNLKFLVSVAITTKIHCVSNYVSLSAHARYLIVAIHASQF